MMVWENPIPVAIALTPIRVPGEVREGLLVVRRAIEPRRGLLGIVGGFLEAHETWQEGAAREVREETGAPIDASALEPFWYTSTSPRPNRVLLFACAPPLDASALPPFTPSPETSERGVIFGPEGLDALFAFPLHVQAAERWLAARAQTGAHDYRAI